MEQQKVATGHIDTQLPLLQHPPLHRSWVEHVVPHLLFTHAMPVGQSLNELQPHAPPTHAWPSDEFSQSTHDSPAPPQLVGWVPLAQCPALQQKPGPHVPSLPVPHVSVHAPALHVGVCPSHTWHTVLAAPHAALVVPSAHVVPSQQPLHSRPPAHDVVHTFIGPQAAPLGQSRTESMQPHTPPTHADPCGDSAQSRFTLQPHSPPMHSGPRCARVQSAQGAALPQLFVVPRHTDESPVTGPSLAEASLGMVSAP
jgi:hypothetical protein